MLISLFLSAASAQVSFEAPIQTLVGPEGIAIKKDGTEVKGKPLIVPKGIGNIKKLTIKLEDGTKIKFVPDDLSGFALKPNKLAKMASTKGSIASMARGTNKSVWSKEYAYFVPAKLPNGKPALLQHLNRGFDSTIQIFADPAGRETQGVGVGGVQISGGMLKSYLVLKKGSDASFLVKKGTYNKLWDQMYGDCDGMVKPEKADFRDFAGHVEMHHNKCGDGGAAAPMEEKTMEEAPAEEAPMEEGAEAEGTDEEKAE